VYNAEGEAVAGLSVSAPIERRRNEWIPVLRNAALELSARLGFRNAPEKM
jgi:DNA-binding IclR family transcriptional regulator